MSDALGPCERAEELRQAIHRAITGKTVKSIRVGAAGNERSMETHAPAKLSEMRAQLLIEEDACRAEQGLPPRRRHFAISVGARRR